MTSPSESGTSPGLREAQAALARRHIAQAALDLFLADGYVQTSMSAIAKRAGVAVQTIYNAVGNKVAVLSAVLDLVAAGPDAPTPVPQFMAARGAATSDVSGLIDVLVDWFAEVHPRSAPLFLLIRQAAALDPDVGRLERARADQRLRNYARAAAQIRERGGLTTGLSDEEGAAVIWSLGHPDTYRALVLDRGWTDESYRAWLATSLRAALE